jgi:rod shape determining protein RodA
MASITAPARIRRRTQDDVGPLAHLDLVLLTLPFVISALGLVMIYDASRRRLENQGLSPFYYVERQSIAIFLGIIAMGIVMMIDYRRVRDLWPVVYLAILPLLAGVLLLGRNHNGAQAWFQVGPLQFQPSELAKLAVIVGLAGYCHQHRGDLDAWRLAVAVGLAGLAMALVYAQHDLGTTLVIMVCATAVLVVAGLKPVHIVVLILLAASLVVAAVASGAVNTYRIQRLTGFADQSAPKVATTASGGKESTTPTTTKTQYTTKYSKAAIASGGLTGAGLGKGRETKNGYVPEQHTDFIFTAVGEDLGFIGGASLIALYALLAWRLWRIALLSSDFFGTLVVMGVLAMFVIHVFENIGMTMGIMPITGIPLPFMSYGGSAIIASFIAIGLVLNIHMRRFS